MSNDYDENHADLVIGDGVFHAGEYYEVLSINTDNGKVVSPLDSITIVDAYPGVRSTITVFAYDIDLKIPVADFV